MSKDTFAKFEITEEKHEGDGWRLIKNADGKKYDYLEIQLPQLGNAQIRLEVQPDGKHFTIYSNDMIFKKKDISFNEIALVAMTDRKGGGYHSDD